jgi:hypothetical protein
MPNNYAVLWYEIALGFARERLLFLADLWVLPKEKQPFAPRTYNRGVRHKPFEHKCYGPMSTFWYGRFRYLSRDDEQEQQYVCGDM